MPGGADLEAGRAAEAGEGGQDPVPAGGGGVEGEELDVSGGPPASRRDSRPTFPGGLGIQLLRLILAVYLHTYSIRY